MKGEGAVIDTQATRVLLWQILEFARAHAAELRMLVLMIPVTGIALRITRKVHARLHRLRPPHQPRRRGSWIDRWRGRALVATYHPSSDFRGLSWQDFERLVAAAFRRWGYQVAETGLGGADGGLDLIATKGKFVTLVQCKHWRKAKVGAQELRAMYGLMHHHQADAIAIVTSGEYTNTARKFAYGKPIELIDGRRLNRLLRPPHPATLRAAKAMIDSHRAEKSHEQ